jgi:hypothetical protein
MGAGVELPFLDDNRRFFDSPPPFGSSSDGLRRSSGSNTDLRPNSGARLRLARGTLATMLRPK